MCKVGEVGKVRSAYHKELVAERRGGPVERALAHNWGGAPDGLGRHGRSLLGVGGAGTQERGGGRMLGEGLRKVEGTDTTDTHHTNTLASVGSHMRAPHKQQRPISDPEYAHMISICGAQDGLDGSLPATRGLFHLRLIPPTKDGGGCTRSGQCTVPVQR